MYRKKVLPNVWFLVLMKRLEFVRICGEDIDLEVSHAMQFRGMYEGAPIFYHLRTEFEDAN